MQLVFNNKFCCNNMIQESTVEELYYKRILDCYIHLSRAHYYTCFVLLNLDQSFRRTYSAQEQHD